MYLKFKLGKIDEREDYKGRNSIYKETFLDFVDSHNPVDHILGGCLGVSKLHIT